MHRREFLRHSAGVGLLALTAAGQNPGRGAPGKFTAAVIGHTGRGNFGHGMELVFNDRPNIEVVALADPVDAGRAKVQERVRARRAYADYREMLEKERPQLVSVAPRWTDQHHAMVSAALAVGAHVYCEKPFMRTLAEADDILATAQRTGRKIAVAHQGRLAPQTLLLKQRLDDGLFGELLEIRVHGKQDKRAGGEDLLVLGTHQFDLVRFFAGDPLWCTARALHGGRDITASDARAVTEDIGLVAADEIEAMFALPRGVNVHYTSRAKNAGAAGPWGMELIGTKGRARLFNDVQTQGFTLHAGPFSGPGESREWLPLAEPTQGRAAEERPETGPPPGPSRDPGRRQSSDSTPTAASPAALPPPDFGLANRLVVDDWLAAIAANREPACSGIAATKSLEMIHAVFAAGLSRGRVDFPLKNRAHPLG